MKQYDKVGRCREEWELDEFETYEDVNGVRLRVCDCSDDVSASTLWLREYPIAPEEFLIRVERCLSCGLIVDEVIENRGVDSCHVRSHESQREEKPWMKDWSSE